MSVQRGSYVSPSFLFYFMSLIRIILLRIVIMVSLLTGALAAPSFGQGKGMPLWDELWRYTTYTPLPKDSSAIKNALDTAVVLYRKDPDAALLIFRQALQASMAQRLPHPASEAFVYIVTIYNSKGMYDQAYREILNTLLFARTYGMDDLLPALYNSMGNRYQRMGRLDSAMFYYYKGAEIIEKDTAFFNKSALPGLYTNLSCVLELTGDYQKGLDYLIKAEAAVRKAGNTYLLALVLINQGNAYTHLDKLDKSVAALHEALRIARKNHLLQWQHLALSNLGSTLYHQGKNKEALAYLEEAVQLKGDIDPSYQNINIAILGKVYFALKNYKQAERYLLQSLQNADRLHIARDRTEANKTLAGLYAAMGDYAKAFEYQYAYTQVKDSVESVETKRNINQLEIKYQTAQKDKALVEKELKINKQLAQIKQKNLWIGIIISGALVLTAIGLLLYRISRHKQRFQSERLHSLEREQEITQLKAVMKGEEQERTRIARELHDGIGGMLASIKMNVGVFREEYPALQEAPTLARIAEMVSGTAIEVRRTAHNLMPDVLDKQSLKEALLLYCEYHNNNNLHIELQYHVPLALSKPAELFIYRIVQELLQNIVKHAEASYAAIQVMLHEQELSITVEDNGKGFDSSIYAGGTGLQNIRSRTEALQGYISIDTTAGIGSTLHLKFDYRKLANL